MRLTRGSFAITVGGTNFRHDDLGILWEHIVLNELQAALQSRQICYWRDKRGHEIDFVLADRRSSPITIECKWSASSFDASCLQSFRNQYPTGQNYVIAHDVTQKYSRNFNDLIVQFISIAELLHI